MTDFDALVHLTSANIAYGRPDWSAIQCAVSLLERLKKEATSNPSINYPESKAEVSKVEFPQREIGKPDFDWGSLSDDVVVETEGEPNEV